MKKVMLSRVIIAIGLHLIIYSGAFQESEGVKRDVKISGMYELYTL